MTDAAGLSRGIADHASPAARAVRPAVARTTMKIGAYQDCVIDGHAPALTGRALQAHVAAGVTSDHESTTTAEALEKLRLGMMVFVREGTVARDLDALLPPVSSATQHRFCFCTDVCQPADLVERGGIDHMVRRTIASGVDPIVVLRMASWNAAQHFRLHNRGALTPGRRADLVVFDDLRAPEARSVIRNGQIVAQDGRMTVARRPPGRSLRGTMNVAWDAVDFRIPAAGRRARVIGALPNSLVTQSLVDEPTRRDGAAVADPERDLVKLAIIERHMAPGGMG